MTRATKVSSDIKIWVLSELHRLEPQLSTIPAIMMLIFLVATLLFILYCRIIWRRGKRFQDV